MVNSFHLDGVKAFNEHHYEIAKDSFLQAVDKNPELAESYFYLGKCYFFCNEMQLAISSLNKFIELKQNTSDEIANAYYAFDLLGQCYEAENNDAAALKCYETATEINPAGASAWHSIGLLYIKFALHDLETDLEQSNHFFKEAKTFLQKALEICSDHPVFLQSIASWYEQYIEVLKRTFEDENAIQKKIAINFSDAIQYYRKALSGCHEQDLALRNIILSNLTECLAQYGHHWYKNNDYKKAQATYLEALHLDPEHLIVINQIGMSFFKQDCFFEARQYFYCILEKTEDKQEIADAWLNIACTHRLEKEWNKAGEALNKAKLLAPEDSFITEEEMKLNESKLATLLISAPQTLFGNSNTEPHDTGNKIVEKSIFQPN
ncbi:MAG: tetratricopeptide repeat protein [Legionella sp.]|nr:tetratricopeptide repeat protein [Legionella sp.]